MSNLKRLLNPVDGDDDDVIDATFDVPFIDRPNFYSNNAASDGAEYNGELPRISANLGPGFLNPAR